MLIMTLGAFHEAFLQRMVRLFVGLCSDIGMAGVAKHRLGDL
jgi:tRNA U38,U39,U40 pseudouridine synthase TruA